MIEVDVSGARLYEFTVPAKGSDRNTDVKIFSNARPFVYLDDNNKLSAQLYNITIGDKALTIRNFDYLPGDINNDGVVQSNKNYFSHAYDDKILQYSEKGSVSTLNRYNGVTTVDNKKASYSGNYYISPIYTHCNLLFGRFYLNTDSLKDDQAFFNGYKYFINYKQDTNTFTIVLDDDTKEDTGLNVPTGWFYLELFITADGKLKIIVDDNSYTSSGTPKSTTSLYDLKIYNLQKTDDSRPKTYVNWYRTYMEEIEDWLKQEIINAEDNSANNLA